MGDKLAALPFSSSTKPYRCIVRGVRLGFDFACPDIVSNSAIVAGFSLTIISRRARFRSDKTFAKLSMDVNQILGSSILGLSCLRVIDMVHRLIARDSNMKCLLHLITPTSLKTPLTSLQKSSSNVAARCTRTTYTSGNDHSPPRSREHCQIPPAVPQLVHAIE